MTKLCKHSIAFRKAALKTSAAFALSCLLVVGLVPFGARGFAETPASGEGTPVVAVVDEKPADQAASKDEPAAVASATEEPAAADEAVPSTPETPDAPEGNNPAPVDPAPAPSEGSGAVEKPAVDEVAWLIGRDDASAVKAGLWPDGTFVLDGAGDTVAFDEVEQPGGGTAVTTPWLAEGYADKIERVVFAQAVQPESLAYWFDGCENLRSVSEIPTSVEDLTAAFRGCKQFDEALELPAGVRVLDSTFKDCASLKVAPAIPASVEDASSAFEGCASLAALPAFEAAPAAMDRMFFECPGIVDVSDAFAFGTLSEACFGFAEQPAEPLATSYAGLDEAVLAYDWAADGRVLVVPEPADAADPPAGDDQASGSADGDTPAAEEEPADAQDPDADGELTGEATEEATEEEPESELKSESEQEPEAAEAATPAEPAAEAAESPKQVSITVPSSVPLLLNADGQGTSAIPVSVANRSETSVRIVGVRLKRSSVDIPGGSWSLVSQETGTHFVDGARFTPSGKEAVLTTPVELAPDSAERRFTWEGTFTDFEMKNLLKMASDANGSFTYGTMIWHIEAV